MTDQTPTEGPDWTKRPGTPPTEPLPPQAPYGQQPCAGGPPYGQPPHAGGPPYGQPPYAGQPGGGGGKKTLWIVLGVIGVVLLLVVGGCTALVLLVRSGPNVSQDPADETVVEQSPSPSDDAPTPTEPSDRPTPSDSDTSEPAPPSGEALALGAPAQFGDLTVAVTDFEPDATTEYQSVGDDVPENGQFGKVTVSVTNEGAEEVFIGFEVSLGLVATDGTEYATADCSATLLDDIVIASAAPGETVTGTTCVDIPASAVPGGQVYGEGFLDFDGTSRTLWAY